MEQIIVSAPLGHEHFPCEVCGEPASHMVRDLVEVHENGAVAIVIHSIHQFCAAHERPPKLLGWRILELVEHKRQPQWLGDPGHD